MILGIVFAKDTSKFITWSLTKRKYFQLFTTAARNWLFCLSAMLQMRQVRLKAVNHPAISGGFQ